MHGLTGVLLTCSHSCLVAHTSEMLIVMDGMCKIINYGCYFLSVA